MSTIKKFAGETAIYGFSTIATRILNFFLTPIYTRVFPAAAFGIITKIYAWISILNAVLAFGMETTFFRYLNKSEHKKEAVYSNTFWVILLLSVVFLTFTHLFIQPIASSMQEGLTTPLADYISYIRYFIYILVFDALCVIPFAKLRAEGRPKRYAFIKTLNIIVFIGLNLVFLFLIPYIIKNDTASLGHLFQWYKAKWVGYIFISNLTASILTFLLLTPELKQIQFKIDKKLLINMFTYSWPILIANLSFILNENVDKIFLSYLLPPTVSDQQLGIYGACCKIAIFLNIFIQAFRLGAEPFFFAQSKKQNAPLTYATIMNYFVLIMALIFVGLVANIEILKYFIRSNDPLQQQLYWSGLGVVPILLFAYVNLGIYMNLSIWYKLSDQTKYGLYISGVGAIITIILNVLLIPTWGFMASAWTTLIVYFSMMVLSYFWGQKHYPIPYNVKKSLMYILIAVVLVFLSFVVFNRNLIVGNLLFLGFTAFLVLREKNDFKKLLSRNEN